MIPQARKIHLTTILLLIFVASLSGIAAGDGSVHENVIRIIDGDTMEIRGGVRVRLLGIDAPEKGEPFSVLAADRLKELTISKMFEIYACQDRDKYGRMLATILVDNINVNEVLLQEGLALPMLIPPCGRPVAEKVLGAAGRGALSGRGVYSQDDYRILPHYEAGQHIGESAMVRGKIVELHRGKKAWHLNFGQDWQTDFTAVLFRDAQRRFNELGVDPAKLVGSEVLVIGKLKRYNGPEIIVRWPGQILPLEGSIIQNPKSKVQNDAQQ